MHLCLPPGSPRPAHAGQHHTLVSLTNTRTNKARAEAVATLIAMPKTMMHRGAVCQDNVAEAGGRQTARERSGRGL